MPKTPSNKLFRLIKSLSGSEKRYFKIFIGDKDSKYVQLFDAMEAQDTFDDEQLREVIYAGEPIQSRKYSELKAYLYDLILKALQAYDEKSSVDFRLKGMLQGVRVLFKRLLFEDCHDLLHKAKKLAGRYEKFATMLEILEWEKQVAYAQTDIRFLDKQMGRIEKEEQQALQQIKEVSELRNIFLRFLVSLRKDASLRSPKQVSRVRNLIDAPLLKTPERITSHQGKILYFRIYSLYYYTLTDFEQFYQTGRQLIDLMESKPYLLEEDVSEYISVLSNLVASCSILGKYEEMGMYLKKFKSVKTKTIDDELKIHRQYYLGMFEYCIRTGAFENGLKLLKQHQSELRKFGSDYFEKSSFYFNYFYIYFGAGDYNMALDSLNNWLNLPKNIERQELQSMARILNLIIHYEMENTLLIESLLRSTYRFLRKRGALSELENLVLNLIKKSNKLYSRREIKEELIRLKKEFRQLEYKASEKAMLRLFDIEAWLDSKINNQSFGETLKTKYLQRDSKNRDLPEK